MVALWPAIDGAWRASEVDLFGLGDGGDSFAYNLDVSFGLLALVDLMLLGL